MPLSASTCRYVANAERTEERLSAEIGRLCGVVEHLKLEMARQVRSPLIMIMMSGASQARDGAPGAISLDYDDDEEWSILRALECVRWPRIASDGLHAQVGVASVREYEETRLRKARERETQLLELRQQESRLAARLTFEERKALSTAAKKLRDSMAKDEKELSALEHKLRPAHEKSDKLKVLYNKANSLIASQNTALQLQVCFCITGAG